MDDHRATRRMLLDLRPEAEQIAGILTDEQGTVRRFSGWLELVAAIGDAWAGPTLGSEVDDS